MAESIEHDVLVGVWPTPPQKTRLSAWPSAVTLESYEPNERESYDVNL